MRNKRKKVKRERKETDREIRHGMEEIEMGNGLGLRVVIINSKRVLGSGG